MCEQARLAAERIDNDELRKDRTLANVVDAMVHTGQFDRAIRVARQLKWHKDMALATIVRAMAKAGASNEAFALADEIEDIESRAEALVESLRLAGFRLSATIRMEVLDRILDLSFRMERGYERTQAQESVVRILVDNGEFQQAISIAERIDDGRSKDSALAIIADGLMSNGSYDEVLPVIQQITSPRIRGSSLNKLADGLRTVGQETKASDIRKLALS